MQTKLRALALLLLVGAGGSVAASWMRAVPPGTVTRCEVYWSHGPRMELTLDGGRRVFLSRDDVMRPENCLPAGSLVEKRRFELVYRVNGREAEPETPTNTVALGLAGLGLLAAGGALVAAMRARGQSSRAE